MLWHSKRFRTWLAATKAPSAIRPHTGLHANLNNAPANSGQSAHVSQRVPQQGYRAAAGDRLSVPSQVQVPKTHALDGWIIFAVYRAPEMAHQCT